MRLVDVVLFNGNKSNKSFLSKPYKTKVGGLQQQLLVDLGEYDGGYQYHLQCSRCRLELARPGLVLRDPDPVHVQSGRIKIPVSLPVRDPDRVWQTGAEFNGNPCFGPMVNPTLVDYDSRVVM